MGRTGENRNAYRILTGHCVGKRKAWNSMCSYGGNIKTHVKEM